MSRFFVALLAAVLLAAPALVRAQAGQASQQRVVSFVSAQWVVDHLKDPDLRILDARPDVSAYFAGHVPGAVHLADGTLRGTDDGLPVQYLSPDLLEKLFRRAGVSDDSKVVIYSDGEQVVAATMVAYALEKSGHKNIMVLDGGLAAFRALAPLARDFPKYERGRFMVHSNDAVRASLRDVKAAKGKSEVKVVDTRAERVYRGDSETWIRNGHIPGAVNLDWHQLVDSGNPHKLKTDDELRQVFAEHGIYPKHRVIVYCGTGREATLEYLILRHVLGFKNVQLYEGSWTEWSAHPELPIEKGAVAEP